MSGYQMTFKRYEKKYRMDIRQYQEFRKRTGMRLIPDEYGEKTIYNIYFDTPDARLIRTSLEKPVYKEKLRLRSYGIPDKNSMVFVELKKKYEGIVYKRRENMILSEAEDYLYRNKRPGFESQVLREIDWFMMYYKNIKPAMYISYDRIAAYDIENPEVRVTFDWNILWRDEALELSKESCGTAVLEPGQYLMEIKIPGAMPVWLGKILDDMKLYPTSFSKYGRAYVQQQTERQKQGGQYCA